MDQRELAEISGLFLSAPISVLVLRIQTARGKARRAFPWFRAGFCPPTPGAAAACASAQAPHSLAVRKGTQPLPRRQATAELHRRLPSRNPRGPSSPWRSRPLRRHRKNRWRMRQGFGWLTSRRSPARSRRRSAVARVRQSALFFFVAGARCRRSFFRQRGELFD